MPGITPFASAAPPAFCPPGRGRDQPTRGKGGESCAVQAGAKRQHQPQRIPLLGCRARRLAARRVSTPHSPTPCHAPAQPRLQRGQHLGITLGLDKQAAPRVQPAQASPCGYQSGTALTHSTGTFWGSAASIRTASPACDTAPAGARNSCTTLVRRRKAGRSFGIGRARERIENIKSTFHRGESDSKLR